MTTERRGGRRSDIGCSVRTSSRTDGSRRPHWRDKRSRSHTATDRTQSSTAGVHTKADRWGRLDRDGNVVPCQAWVGLRPQPANRRGNTTTVWPSSTPRNGPTDTTPRPDLVAPTRSSRAESLTRLCVEERGVPFRHRHATAAVLTRATVSGQSASEDLNCDNYLNAHDGAHTPSRRTLSTPL
jgi:hypothetical protein